ncbi:MAG: EamA family transporter [Hyphomicrobiaceae bacterium]
MSANGAAGASRGAIAGIVIAALAALAISVSNVSLPLYYGRGGNVETFLAARYAISVAICLAILVARRASLSLTAGELWSGLGSGIVYGAGSLLVLGSIALIPVSLAILIFFTFPILTTLMQAPLDRRMPSPGQLGCLLAALAGIGLALEIGEVAYDPVGLVMALGGAFGIAGAFVWSGHALPHKDSNLVTVTMSIAALAIALGFALGSGNGVALGVPTLAWIAFGVAVAGGVAAFIAMFKAIQLAGATRAAAVMNLEPVFTMAFAAVVLAERITLLRAVGAAIVVGAVFASQWLAHRAGGQAAERSGVAERGRAPAARRTAGDAAPPPRMAVPSPRRGAAAGLHEDVERAAVRQAAVRPGGEPRPAAAAEPVWRRTPAGRHPARG